MIKTNMNNVDRGIRAVVGLAAILAGWYFGSMWGLLGVIPLATSLVGFCPMYCPLGISTCPVKTSPPR